MGHITKLFKKNPKGFSLVELIIVVAIMVAIVAVMTPAYLRYLSKARDAIVTDAAENVLSFCKTEFGDNEFYGTGTITVKKSPEGHLGIYISDGITYCGKTGDEASEVFMKACGVDAGKRIRSNLAYIIYVDRTVFSRPILETETTRLSEDNNK